ncbi:unnamed protein product, partial [Ectocarpus sp. 13 AM-2016]
SGRRRRGIGRRRLKSRTGAAFRCSCCFFFPRDGLASTDKHDGYRNDVFVNVVGEVQDREESCSLAAQVAVSQQGSAGGGPPAAVPGLPQPDFADERCFPDTLGPGTRQGQRGGYVGGGGSDRWRRWTWR